MEDIQIMHRASLIARSPLPIPRLIKLKLGGGGQEFSIRGMMLA